MGGKEVNGKRSSPKAAVEGVRMVRTNVAMSVL